MTASKHYDIHICTMISEIFSIGNLLFQIFKNNQLNSHSLQFKTVINMQSIYDFTKPNH